jgi:hypothetical protein
MALNRVSVGGPKWGLLRDPFLHGPVEALLTYNRTWVSGGVPEEVSDGVGI